MAVYRANKRKKSNAKIWIAALMVIAIFMSGALLVKNKTGKREDGSVHSETISEQSNIKNYIPDPIGKNKQGLHHFIHDDYGAATEDNFYYIQNQDNGQFIWTINFQGKQHRPLCGKPGCAHNDDTCDAYIPGRNYSLRLTEWNGKLYLMDWPGDHENPGGIQEMELDGSNRHYIHKFEDGDMWVFDNQIVSEDTLYINYYSVPNGYASHSFIYRQGDQQAIECPVMLKAEDNVITGIGDNVLSLRYESLTSAGTKEFVLIDTNGETAAWIVPENYRAAREHIVDGKLYDVDDVTEHFKSIDLLTLEEIDYGKIPFKTSYLWWMVMARDGNAVLQTETGSCYQADQQGVKKLSAGYMDRNGLIQNRIDADAGDERYLLEDETDTGYSNFKIILKNDFWNSKETGEPVPRQK